MTDQIVLTFYRAAEREALSLRLHLIAYSLSLFRLCFSSPQSASDGSGEEQMENK